MAVTVFNILVLIFESVGLSLGIGVLIRLDLGKYLFAKRAPKGGRNLSESETQGEN
jgi:hypothetical protein